ncbi:MAG: hypothetical protein IM638_04235 [Bacteroidetes bacterium]|nr:hypothetical protein [Bacteroidota bacterium]
MNNGQLHDDPLFRAVQERLGDYETPYDGADWDAMNRSLNQLPKNNRFRFRFSLNTVLALIGATGAIVLATWLLTRSDTAVQEVVAKPAAKYTQPSHTNTPSPPAIADNTPSVRPESIMAALPVRVQRKTYLNQSQPDVSNLRFGDQIDPLRGFVNPTSEKMDTLHVPDQSPPSLTPFIHKAVDSSADLNKKPESTGNNDKSSEDVQTPR